MKQIFQFEIPILFPTLNELLNKKAQTQFGTMNQYAYTKKLLGTQTRLFLRTILNRYPFYRPFFPLTRNVSIEFVWQEPTCKRDPDNLAAAGTKILLDAFVAEGILKGDGWSIYQANSYGPALVHRFLAPSRFSGVTVNIHYWSELYSREYLGLTPHQRRPHATKAPQTRVTGNRENDSSPTHQETHGGITRTSRKETAERN